MISATKTTFSHYNLKILKSKVTQNLTNFRKKFCEFPPWATTASSFNCANVEFLPHSSQDLFLEIRIDFIRNLLLASFSALSNILPLSFGLKKISAVQMCFPLRKQNNINSIKNAREKETQPGKNIIF